MFVAYLARLFQGTKGSELPKEQPELDEFGDPISQAELTPEQRKISDEFDGAVNLLPKIVSSLPEAVVLRLYALYKQATAGPAHPPNRPSMLDLRGRTKFDAWAKLGSLDKFDAMREYGETIAEFSNLPGMYEANKSTAGFGLRPSTMQQPEEETFSDEPEAAWFNAVKDGNVVEVRQMLSERNELLEVHDQENGMTALLWATDSGHMDVVKLLLSHGADINAVDSDGNSPLHLANICGHNELCLLLINSGADKDILNNEGQTAVDFLEE